MLKKTVKIARKKQTEKRPAVTKDRGGRRLTAPLPSGKKKVKQVLGAKRQTKKLSKPESLQANVLGLDGKIRSKLTLPTPLFASAVPRELLALAVRVYLSNQREGSASTKTRGQVEGSTRKIYRQKGTGRARHGAIRAPIFVGGGIVFGPKPRDYRRQLPKKMRRLALAGALTAQYRDGNIVIVDGLGDLEPKTKILAQTLAQLGATKRTLLVVGKDSNLVVRAARNIKGVDVMSVSNLNTYAILVHDKLVFTKEALERLKETNGHQHGYEKHG